MQSHHINEESPRNSDKLPASPAFCEQAAWKHFLALLGICSLELCCRRNAVIQARMLVFQPCKGIGAAYRRSSFRAVGARLSCGFASDDDGCTDQPEALDAKVTSLSSGSLLSFVGVLSSARRPELVKASPLANMASAAGPADGEASSVGVGATEGIADGEGCCVGFEATEGAVDDRSASARSSIERDRIEFAGSCGPSLPAAADRAAASLAAGPMASRPSAGADSPTPGVPGASGRACTALSLRYRMIGNCTRPKFACVAT